MTAKEFLVKFLDCEEENLGDFLCDELSDGNYSEILKAMQEYARLMCDKQKEICAENTSEILFGSYAGAHQVMDDSVLNSPYPEELL